MGSKHITIAFIASPEIEAALRKATSEQDRSASWIIRKALAAYLGLTRPAGRKPKRQ